MVQQLRENQTLPFLFSTRSPCKVYNLIFHFKLAVFLLPDPFVFIYNEISSITGYYLMMIHCTCAWKRLFFLLLVQQIIDMHNSSPKQAWFSIEALIEKKYQKKSKFSK
jgi:hypothetical protein